MQELSLHLLDVAENSVRAGADRVYITVCETPSADRLTITVRDNGCGMDEATLARVGGANTLPQAAPRESDRAEATPRESDRAEAPPRESDRAEAAHRESRRAETPPCTPRVPRGGMGIPLLKQAAHLAGGGVVICSASGRGTTVTAEFELSHQEGIPLGDAAASVVTLAQGSPGIDFIFTYQFEAEKFSVSTRERMTALSDEIPGSGDFAAYVALLEFIREGIQKTKGRRHIKMKNLEELCALRDKMKPTMGIRADDSGNTRVIVGMATCGIEAGARPVLLSFVEECAKNGLTGVTVAQTGCLGICAQEPVVEVVEPGKEKVTYVKMTAEKAAEVVKKHLIGGKAIAEYTIGATNK